MVIIVIYTQRKPTLLTLCIYKYFECKLVFLLDEKRRELREQMKLWTMNILFRFQYHGWSVKNDHLCASFGIMRNRSISSTFIKYLIEICWYIWNTIILQRHTTNTNFDMYGKPLASFGTLGIFSVFYAKTICLCTFHLLVCNNMHGSFIRLKYTHFNVYVSISYFQSKISAFVFIHTHTHTSFARFPITNSRSPI